MELLPKERERSNTIMGLRVLGTLFFILFTFRVPAFSQDTAVMDDASQEADVGNDQADITTPDANSQVGDLGTDAADRAGITDENLDDASQEADVGNDQADITTPDANDQAGDLGTDAADRAGITDQSQAADLH
jgi:hypothetical protein